MALLAYGKIDCRSTNWLEVIIAALPILRINRMLSYQQAALDQLVHTHLLEQAAWQVS